MDSFGGEEEEASDHDSGPGRSAAHENHSDGYRKLFFIFFEEVVAEKAEDSK